MSRKVGRPAGPRGPYKTGNDVKDPDQTGAAGLRLRQHRLARLMTVDQLAERSGLSQGTISGIENGKGYSPETLESLANALGTTVGALFSIDPRPGKGGEFWAIWDQASDGQKQRILDYASGVVGVRPVEAVKSVAEVKLVKE